MLVLLRAKRISFFESVFKKLIMPICKKCNESIKPAALACTVKGEEYHPTCIYCATCNKKLWGKPFKRTKEGKLVCERACTPLIARPTTATIPPSIAKVRPGSAQQNRLIEQPTDLSSPKSNANNFSSLNSTPRVQNSPRPEKNQSILNTNSSSSLNYVAVKTCKICKESVSNKRFITFENGEIICNDCDLKNAPRPPRIKSAHLIVCSICNKTVQGRKYFTEPDGKIVCDSCELNAARCYKCKNLFVFNEDRRKLSNGLEFHIECFICVVCSQQINTKDFFENETGMPMCLSCFEISKLPKCLKCKNHISGAYLMVENQAIHYECFRCSQCESNLETKNGYFKHPVSGEPICMNCNHKINAAKCAKCQNPVVKDGISYAEKDYHQTCFKCDICSIELTKMKKIMNGSQGNLYCEICFVKHLSPKCGKCNEPIPPQFPGTVYEDKIFHKSCFACARCKKTLANKKFFKAGKLLICEACF